MKKICNIRKAYISPVLSVNTNLAIAKYCPKDSRDFIDLMDFINFTD